MGAPIRAGGIDATLEEIKHGKAGQILDLEGGVEQFLFCWRMAHEFNIGTDRACLEARRVGLA
jgi:hypothetical protein